MSVVNRWIKVAAECISSRGSIDFLDALTKRLKKELGINSVYSLRISEDGRSLEYNKNGQNLTWSVSDFSHPFAHVIQSGTTMLLQSREIFYWLSDSTFKDLVTPISDSDSLAIVPMYTADNYLKVLLIFQGSHESIAAIENDKNFFYSLMICSNQLQLLHDIENRKQKSNQLFQSLTDAEASYKKHHIAEELASILIGSSNEMKKLREQIVNAASSHLSVMVQGETGTGKELVSRAVHDLSSRSKNPFVAINCAAIPESLLESELFGYAKGAFSGAEKDKKGLLGEANGGTLFLDEIGDMPMELQSKLLRVLETKAYRPVGGKMEILSDFRLVAATHVNLKEKIANNTFRKDLYYRIFQYPILLPALVNRKSDIEQLCKYFIKQYNLEQKKTIRGLHYLALDQLIEYSFPGNVRELKHLIEFGCSQTNNDDEIGQMQIVSRLDSGLTHASTLENNTTRQTQNRYVNDLKVAMKNYEISIIAARLKEFKGDRLKTAESLGIPKRTLADKCLKLEIVVNE